MNRPGEVMIGFAPRFRSVEMGVVLIVGATKGRGVLQIKERVRVRDLSGREAWRDEDFQRGRTIGRARLEE